MNTYLYAPKDDYKHRLDWRELYTDEQAGMCLPACFRIHDITVLKWYQPTINQSINQKQFV